MSFQKFRAPCSLPLTDKQSSPDLSKQESLLAWRKFKSSIDEVSSSYTRSKSRWDSEPGHFDCWPALELVASWILGQHTLQWPGLPQVKHTPELDLWDKVWGRTRVNKLGNCEAESCEVVEETGATNLLCWTEREAKRFIDLAALDLAL